MLDLPSLPCLLFSKSGMGRRLPSTVWRQIKQWTNHPCEDLNRGAKHIYYTKLCVGVWVSKGVSERATRDLFHTLDGELHPALDLAVDQSQAAEAASTLNGDPQRGSTFGEPPWGELVVRSGIILPLERHTSIQRGETLIRSLVRDQTTA